MNSYWHRLKNHPGVPIVSVITVLFCLAGIGKDDTSLLQAIAIGLAVSAPFWVIVLWTARTQPLPEEEEK